VSKQATLRPHGGTRVANFIDVGDPAAPIGSPAWCKASHLQLCATKRQTDLDVRHLKFHLVDFKEKERWKQLTNDKDKPFRSWKEYLTYPEPNGLGISEESADAIMGAVDGALIGEVLGKQGHPSNGSKGSNTTNGTVGRGAKYIAARLERDGHTELAAKVRSHEIAAIAAAYEVGYRKPPTPFALLKKQIVKLRPKLSDDDREELRRMLE
jgi:hypothetical protein